MAKPFMKILLEMLRATAGTGDVLTGMITSLLAQSYEPVSAILACISTD
jgi:NAD(P)H-hydrate repair Nnr-like enzyme with NAD(P)H-hydrate dehydratase domain